MAFHVYMKHPDHHAAPILNGITQRPFSWPTREAAQAYIDDCQKHGVWQGSRDDFNWIFQIRPASGAEE